MPIVRAPAGTNVIMVVGPTSAGKSTLDELLVKRTELALATLQKGRGRIPWSVSKSRRRNEEASDGATFTFAISRSLEIRSFPLCAERMEAWSDRMVTIRPELPRITTLETSPVPSEIGLRQRRQ